jgi:hypothetical protein
MMLWMSALFLAAALIVVAFVIAYVLVSIYVRREKRETVACQVLRRRRPEMSGARRFVSKHALLLLFTILFAWSLLGTILALRAG